MSTPPTPPGHPGPYGQQPPPPGPPGQPPAAYPYGTPGAPPAGGGLPPRKGGVPVWVWIAAGSFLVLLLCICGGIGLIVLSDDDPTSSESTSVVQSTTQPPSTTTPLTSAPTTTAPTATDPTTASPTTPSSDVPPTPAGSTPNTDSSRTLKAGDVESQIARGMSQFGHTKSDISCPSDLVLVAGRTTTCTAPVPGGTGRSDVTVEVAWAVNVSTETRYYLTFRQKI